MAWKKSSPELVRTFETVLPGPPAEPRQMFGFPCAFVNGNMFMGLHEERMILRLGDEDRQRMLRVRGATLFEPTQGKPMKEYVVVPLSVLGDEAALRGWVNQSLGYATSLPQKKKPAKKKKAAAKPKTKKRG
jgi:TfoX/Sxy family transcriptional regulator of competence genes